MSRKEINRAIILVVDGFGIGSAPDADVFGDVGSNTFANIADRYASHHKKPLSLPNLQTLGLDLATRQTSDRALQLDRCDHREGAYAAAKELSTGKDTPSGHWEMTGVPVLFDWGYYPEVPDCFPQKFLDTLLQQTGVSGVLGCCHASGTDIIRELGEQHINEGKPICYTSADSVFQVAAHEAHFGLGRLYEFCEAARELLYDDNIGRVIARPFVGESAITFERTGNRRDYAIAPPEATLLDKVSAAGYCVSGIGKISDIFAARGVTRHTKATGLEALLDETIHQLGESDNRGLIFTNLVNFDQDFGHRRNPLGYADALAYFDSRLADVQAAMGADDLLFITSDHGCDPTWQGTDHTREYVPLLCWRHGMQSIDLGIRESFADLGQTLAELFDVDEFHYGKSFAGALFT